MANQETESDNGEQESIGPANLLEDKYRKQMRQIHPQKIELPISTLQAMIKEQITLNPDFQRRDRWDNKKRSRFVESVIMNVPVPPVFLGEDEYGAYVVLDGRQRLTAIHEFLNNAFPLEGLTVWEELNGLRYVDLEKSGLNKTLTRRFVPAILLLKESSPEVKYDVFDRLNTGGVKANEMEIRNAVFRGEFTKLIHELSALPSFRRLWGIPEDAKALADNTLYSTMTDVEYVLRFFSLRSVSLIEGRFKDYLSYFMKGRNDRYATNPGLREEDGRIFRSTVELAFRLLGDEAFMRVSTDGKPRRSAPLADAVLYAISALDPAKIVEGDAAKVAQAIQGLFSNERFVNAITAGTNGKGAITERTSLAHGAVVAAVPNAVRE